MKKILFIILIAFGCEQEMAEPKEPPCEFPFVYEDYEIFGDEWICYILNDTTYVENYSYKYQYVMDSLYHCHSNQTIELCD